MLVPRRVVAFVVVAAMGVSACGGGDSESSDVASEPADTNSVPADTNSEPTDTNSVPADTNSEPDDTNSDPAETTEAVIPEGVDVDSGPDESESAAPDESTETIDSDLPAVVVTDVGNGGQFNLADLAPSDRPILLWFWAPH